MGTTPIYGFPYPDPSDLVANYPALGQQLAEDVENALASSGKILQLVSTTKTDTYSLTSQTFTEITGLTATITPSSATNKIFVQAVVQVGFNPAVTRSALRLMRDATAIAIGDASSNRTPASAGGNVASSSNIETDAVQHLDSPASVSALTYSVQIRASDSGQTVHVNRSFNDTDNATFFRVVSTITVMEVSA